MFINKTDFDDQIQNCEWIHTDDFSYQPDQNASADRLRREVAEGFAPRAGWDRSRAELDRHAERVLEIFGLG